MTTKRKQFVQVIGFAWLLLAALSVSAASYTNDLGALTLDSTPPAISQQPTNPPSWPLGSLTSSFSVVVTNTRPLAYQWFNGTNALVDGGRLSGCTNSTLVVSNVQVPDAGGYSVVLSNVAGVVTSRVAMLFTTAPVITSSLLSTNTEGSNSLYQITATNAPAKYGAAGLPLGLTINPDNGQIRGVFYYSGTYDVLLLVSNAWGTGSNLLRMNVTLPTLTGLSISDVEFDYSAPYLLDFMFSLRDNVDPNTGHAVVRPRDNFTVTVYENGEPMDPYESAIILDQGARKQLRCYVVLDYSGSMSKTNTSQPFPLVTRSPSVVAMETAAKTFISQMPDDALVGIYEFHNGISDPAKVTDFTMDKSALLQAIDQIWTNPALDITNTAGSSRCWDGVNAAINQFDNDAAVKADEHRYVVAISDGKNNASRYATTNTVVTNAVARDVKLYMVGYGTNITTNTLSFLSSRTKGRFYIAQDPTSLATQFGWLGKDIDGQYIVRWATPRRFPESFRPSFVISCSGRTATYNLTNAVEQVPQFLPTAPQVVGGETNGVLRFVSASSSTSSALMLRASYVPMNINRLRIHYRANYPCTVSLRSTNAGEILDGYTLTETNDGSGGRWLEVANPNRVIPFAAMGSMLWFELRDMKDPQTAFSLFEVDNSIYPASLGVNFAVTNRASFVLNMPALAHGTPISWLLENGFTNDFSAAELSDPDGDGVPTWQEYLAGTNPRDAASKFVVRTLSSTYVGGNQQYSVRFTTVPTRTYRVEASSDLKTWVILQDNIQGDGQELTVTDTRGATAYALYRIVAF
jgi:hypothetical protein